MSGMPTVTNAHAFPFFFPFLQHEQALWEGLYLRLRAAFDAKHPDYIFTRSANGTKKKGTRGGKKHETAVASDSASASPASSKASLTTSPVFQVFTRPAPNLLEEEDEEDELEEARPAESPRPQVTLPRFIPRNDRLRAVAPAATIDLPRPRVPQHWPAFMPRVPALELFSPSSNPHTTIGTPHHGRSINNTGGRCAECRNRDEKHDLICISTGTCSCGPEPHKECSASARIISPVHVGSKERDYFQRA